MRYRKLRVRVPVEKVLSFWAFFCIAGIIVVLMFNGHASLGVSLTIGVIIGYLSSLLIP